MADQKKGGKGHKPNLAAVRKRALYKGTNQLFKNKVKRIARSNGYTALMAYRKAHAGTGVAGIQFPQADHTIHQFSYHAHKAGTPKG